MQHIYLGLFDQEGDAAKAYDRALVRLRGTNAATNNSLSEYKKELQEHSQHQVRLDSMLVCCRQARPFCKAHLPELLKKLA